MTGHLNGTWRLGKRKVYKDMVLLPGVMSAEKHRMCAGRAEPRQYIQDGYGGLSAAVV